MKPIYFEAPPPAPVVWTAEDEVRLDEAIAERNRRRKLKKTLDSEDSFVAQRPEQTTV